MHEADLPRIAIYSSWTGTQEIGWVRFTFDKFGIPYDLIYKERVKKGNLRNDYDVIVMPTQQANRQAVYQAPAARPVPYMKETKYKFLGMYGESPDITGGMGGEGVDAFAKFLDAGARSSRWGMPCGSRPSSVSRARSTRPATRRATSTRRVRSSTPKSCARPSGVLRLHGEDHADQIPGRPADDRRRAGPGGPCWRATSAATRRS